MNDYERAHDIAARAERIGRIAEDLRKQCDETIRFLERTWNLKPKGETKKS